MIKLALVDDNSFLIQALIEKLSFFDDIDCKFVASNGQEFLNALPNFPTIELVLMDIEMPGMDGIQTTGILKKRYPHIKVIMLTVFDNYEKISGAIHAGADGYLLKDVGPEELYQSIVRTMNGGATMSPTVAMKTLQMLREPASFSENSESESDKFHLSSRELAVLKQLSTGLKYDQIATNLFLSVGTIRKHVENIYTKLDAHNKLEAIQKARLHKLI